MNTSPVILRSETIQLFAAAFSAAQGEFANPKRNKTVTVTTKTGRSYTFAYADLGAIIDAVRMPLAKNGLAFMQMLVTDESGKFRLQTQILHSSGEWVATSYPLVIEDIGSNQSFGSGLSYMRRYSLSTTLGIAAEDDDDGNVAEGNTATATDVIKRKPKAPAPNVMQPSPAVAPPADERVPPVSRSGVADGARGLGPLSESDIIKAYDDELAKAAATGDRTRLQAAWNLVLPQYRESLRGALERRHVPACKQVAKEKEEADGRDRESDDSEPTGRDAEA